MPSFIAVAQLLASQPMKCSDFRGKTDTSATKYNSMCTGVNPGGGGMYPPTFLGGGIACTNIPPPPLFEDKITLNLTFIVKKLTF